MAYYRSWRSRGWRGSSAPSKYTVLAGLFGAAVPKIHLAFLCLNADALDELFSDYGAIHGESAEKYARKTFPKWRSNATVLSGQTMERLIELVPPYLSAEQRFSILRLVISHHKKSSLTRTVKINIKEPEQGFSELQQILASMSHDNALAHLPENAMKAATWLYDDDSTASRAMLAEAELLENELIRNTAIREIELLRRTISTGQIKSANYNVAMPAGKLNVIVFTPSKCFVATVCFGQDAPETVALRKWRDIYLIEQDWGRKFIVWYYNNGEKIAKLLSYSIVLKVFAKFCISMIAKIISNKLIRGMK